MIRPATLVCLTTALSAIVGLNWHWLNIPLDLSPIATKAPVLAEAGELSVAPGIDLRMQVSEALRRPLFHIDRRPFEPPAPVEAVAVVEEAPMPQSVQPQAAPAPELRLAGISLSGETKRALLGLAGSDDVRWYGQGEGVDGWVVTTIDHDAVTLASGDLSFVVLLYPATAARAGN